MTGMAKAIIFCADGTWNGPEDATGSSVIDSNDVHGELLASSVTNVVKLYANLAGQVSPETLRLSDEQEKMLVAADGSTVQIAKYLHGVGDSQNIAIKLMGGIFGAGVIARVVRGFTFISRNYLPGDAIHIVGFSRGAYTARALAGMIARVGLLDPRVHDLTDRANAYRLGSDAWFKSHSIAITASPIRGLADLLGHCVDYVENWIGRSLRPDSLIPNVPIRSVAVWDTVGSMGIPEYIKDRRIDLFRFVDLGLSSKVDYGFHAMAIDEMRADFPVTRWDPRQNVTQRWFVGAHADVGGGYPVTQSGLSDTALAWLGDQLTTLGVDFSLPPVYSAATDKYTQAIHTPWENAPFSALRQCARHVESTDIVDESVSSRLKLDPSYRPIALSEWINANSPRPKTAAVGSG
jgi:uncharacterized protein (DUF2235 family)